ncbi:MAG: ABC transporter ATP-binding protein [Anaerolineae bacterium]|nr:ABC transporter ATP-binding protein [Anaerolineae bacterium]
MIHIDHVDFAYPHPLTGQTGGGNTNIADVDSASANTRTVLRDVSLQMESGDVVVVMGATGSGKSTLCHMLAGLAPRYTGGTVSGMVRVAGHDVVAALPPVGTIGCVFQDAATQVFNTTVEDEIAWGLESLAVHPGEIGPRVNDALARFGLHEVQDRPPWALSGGQQKRLALASVWVMRPRVLLLDEPLGSLDPEGRVEILDTLAALRQEGTTLLLTTLRPQAARLAPRAALLASASLAETDTATLLADEAQLYRAGILYPQNRWPDLHRMPASSPLYRGGSPTEEATIAVNITGLHYTYPNGTRVFQDLELKIPRGQFVALVGANGAGKTTLLRHLNGLLRPAAGHVHVMGLDTARHTVGNLARQVGLLFQRPEQQLFGATVREEITYGPRHLRLPDVEGRVMRALVRFGLHSVAEYPPATLSYGQQRAITLAILDALATPIIALDEPTVGLDGRGWEQFLTWLVEQRAAGVTVILATHDLMLAAQADRIITLEHGRVIADEIPVCSLTGG